MNTNNSMAGLVDAFRVTLQDLRRLYRESAEDCLERHGTKFRWPREEFLQRMHNLHAALAVKVFITVIRADIKCAPGEQALAQELIDHLWAKRLSDNDLQGAMEHLLNQESRIRWWSAVRPFAELPVFRERQSMLEALVFRLVNIIAKVDGNFGTAERQVMDHIRNELDLHLKAEPLAETTTASVLPQSQQKQDLTSQAPTLPLGGAPLPPAPPAPPPQPSREEQLAAALADLDQLVGLESVKKEVRTLTNFLKMQEERKKQNLPITSISLHTVFCGNPGTGKTSVARILGRIFGAMGVLKKGHLVETDRSGLVAEYAGQTGPKVNKRVNEALDGVLFIDEAYSLVAEEGDDPYGAEAMQTLLKRMEDDRHRLVVMLAGYPEPMERLLQCNPGLSSRFNRRIDFPDYTAAELGAIFQKMCDANHYVLPGPVRARLLLGFQYLLDRRDERFGNGRLARNVFEDAIRNLANRIANVSPITKKLLTTLEPQDCVLPNVPESALVLSDDAPPPFFTHCPQCRQESPLPISHLGKRVKCNACGHGYTAEWGELKRQRAKE